MEVWKNIASSEKCLLFASVGVKEDSIKFHNASLKIRSSYGCGVLKRYAADDMVVWSNDFLNILLDWPWNEFLHRVAAPQWSCDFEELSPGQGKTRWLVWCWKTTQRMFRCARRKLITAVPPGALLERKKRNRCCGKIKILKLVKFEGTHITAFPDLRDKIRLHLPKSLKPRGKQLHTAQSH